MALLSRVAESLFWLGRSVERAENTARLLDVTFHGRLEPMATELAGARNTWQALVATLGLGPSFGDRTPDESTVIAFLTVDHENASAMVSSLASARENARGVRDFLSSESWIAINRLYHATARGNLHLIMADGLYDFCDEVRQGCQLFWGTVASTSLHDEGWHWLQCGRYLERADMVTRIVDSKYHLLLDSIEEVDGPIDSHQWAALLRSVSGYEAYRRTHAAGLEPARIIEFLVLDPEFPRSLRAIITSLQSSLDRATDGAERRLRNPPLHDLTDLKNQLEYESVEALIGRGLHEFLEAAQGRLARVSLALSETFFWTGAHAA